MSGKIETFHAKPNKFLQRMTLPGIGDIEEGFDGTVGWSMSPLTGPTLLDGQAARAAQVRRRLLSRSCKPTDRYASMTTVEKTTFEGRPVYKIQLVKKDGDEDIEFYDVETGLKAGSRRRRANHRWGPCRARRRSSDYKKFGTLLQPTTIEGHADEHRR